MSRVQAHRTNSEYKADHIYFFMSVDGFYRQRCGRHVPLMMPTAATFIWRSEKVGSSRHSCIECYWERRNELRGGEDDVIENWE